MFFICAGKIFKENVKYRAEFSFGENLRDIFLLVQLALELIIFFLRHSSQTGVKRLVKQPSFSKIPSFFRGNN